MNELFLYNPRIGITGIVAFYSKTTKRKRNEQRKDLCSL